jgi:hypothetical protein
VSWRAVLLAGLVVVATAAALVVAARPHRDVGPGGRLRHRPGTWLLVVVALVYLNQVLVTAYVFAAHAGDPGFIARYLPAGWFALVEPDSLLGRVARAVPAAGALEWSVLRVPAFLELPLVLLAYLTACRWFGDEVFARALRQVRLASAVYTATFCLIEISLPNPYTADDVVIRVVAGVLVPLGLGRLRGPVAGAAPLVAAVVSAVGLGGLVLVVYDTALLYDLGHLGARLPWAAAAGATLLAGRLLARRGPERVRPGTALLSAAFGWFLVLFFVPALPLRYGLGFGAAPVAAVAGLVIVVVAVVRGFRDVRDRMPVPVALLVGELVAGAIGGVAGFALAGGFPEVRLLVATAAALGAALVVGYARAPAAARP